MTGHHRRAGPESGRKRLRHLIELAIHAGGNGWRHLVALDVLGHLLAGLLYGVQRIVDVAFLVLGYHLPHLGEYLVLCPVGHLPGLNPATQDALDPSLRGLQRLVPGRVRPALGRGVGDGAGAGNRGGAGEKAGDGDSKGRGLGV